MIQKAEQLHDTTGTPLHSSVTQQTMTAYVLTHGTSSRTGPRYKLHTGPEQLHDTIGTPLNLP
jgi:hypothetical protein